MSTLLLTHPACFGHEPGPHHPERPDRLRAVLAATAMAVQNTAARTSLGGLPPTTVMTGNLMQIIVDLLDVLHGHGAVEAKRARLANLVSLMLAFSAGAITGAVGYLTIGFLALIAPILAALTLGLFARPHPATGT